MKSSQKINSLEDLKVEIARLSVRKKEQELYLLDQYELLKAKVESPIRFFKNFTTVVPGAGIVKGVASNISKAMKGKDADWLTNVLQIGTPLVLNSTLLRNAGWLKKAVVLLASETAVGQVNQSKISSLIGKVTNFIRPKNKKKKKKKDMVTAEVLLKDENLDLGQPTSSETY